MSKELSTISATGVIQSLDDMERVAKSIAESGLFGITKPAQATALFLLCQSEGLNPIAALRRYHIVQNRPTMRADAMQAEFETRGGGIFWNLRNEKKVIATFYADRKTMTDEKAIERARKRAAAILDGDEKAMMELTYPGEETIYRSIEDAIEKKIAVTWDKDAKPATWVLKDNWKQSPRQMLTARCVTEGVRLVSPGLIAGIYTEDEVRDIADTESDTFGGGDEREKALKQIIEEKREMSLEAATEADRKRLQAEASDLQIQLDNAEGEKLASARAIEPSQPEATEQSAEETPSKPKPIKTDWREMDFGRMTLGVTHPCYGKTLGAIFDTGEIKFADRIAKALQKSYMAQMADTIAKSERGESGPPHPDDQALYDALRTGIKRLEERQKETP